MRETTLNSKMSTLCCSALAVLMGILFPFASPVGAQEAERAVEVVEEIKGDAPSTSDLGTGLVVGPRWGRPPLTGDWFGYRKKLADHGLTFGLDVVNILQSVVDGGFDEETENNGSMYLEAQLDTGKADLWPGGFLDFRFEKSYGQSVNAESGQLLGGNMVALFPDGDDKTAVISKLLYTQFLADWFGVFIGRTDTADGEGNHFASGRGRTQFLNPRFAFSPQAALTTPYVMNAIGTVLLTPNPAMDRPGAISFLFADPQVEPDDSGFDNDFFKEQYLALDAHYPTRFFDLPGSQNLVITWNSQDFIRLGDLSEIGTPGFQLDKGDSVWTLGYNFHQYLHVRDGEDIETEGYDATAPMLRGCGVFGRFGYSNADNNPTEFSWVLGLSGRGIADSRPDDVYAVAGYVSTLSDDLEIPGIDIEDETWGVEAYYKIQVLSWLQLTPDIQILGPFLESADTAVLLGLRTKVDF